MLAVVVVAACCCNCCCWLMLLFVARPSHALNLQQQQQQPLNSSLITHTPRAHSPAAAAAHDELNGSQFVAQASSDNSQTTTAFSCSAHVVPRRSGRSPSAHSKTA